jgi:hypothetical protein
MGGVGSFRLRDMQPMTFTLRVGAGGKVYFLSKKAELQNAFFSLGAFSRHIQQIIVFAKLGHFFALFAVVRGLPRAGGPEGEGRQEQDAMSRGGDVCTNASNPHWLFELLFEYLFELPGG